MYEGLQGLVDGGDRIRSMASATSAGSSTRAGPCSAPPAVPTSGPARARRAGAQPRRARHRRAGRHRRRRQPQRCRRAAHASGRYCSTSSSATAPSTGPRPTPIADCRWSAWSGSIDNDMFGTDMTIGADTALHRITEAVDAHPEHGIEPSAHVRHRGDGPPLRLPRADGRPGGRRQLRPDPREPARRGLGDRDV